MPRRFQIFILCLLFVIALTGGTEPVSAQGDIYPHIVQPGDTLLDLSLFYASPLHELAAANEELDLSLPVGSGEIIGVPVAFPIDPAITGQTNSEAVPAVYTVQRGDTLFRIATRFNVAVAALAAANDIWDIDSIYVGQQLIIPTDDFDFALVEEELSTVDAPPPTIDEGKQIVVVLSQQKLFAYEDGVLLRQFVVSTGLPGTPTVVGDFAVYVKYDSQHMSGPGYSLPNVPWVMYFYRGYGIHGTYWHNNFGQPMSHGCINMRTPEAEWLYNWAPVGTPVHVSN